ETVHQGILLSDVMSVKRRPPYIRAIDNVLNRDDLVAFLDHQRYQSLVQHLPGPLYAAIHADPPRFSEQIGDECPITDISAFAVMVSIVGHPVRYSTRCSLRQVLKS